MLALAVHVIINIRDLYKLPEDATRVQRRYRHFLYGLICYYTADILWGILYGWRIIPLAYFDTAMFFATMGLTVFLWMRYIVSFLDHKSIFTTVLEYCGAGIFAFQILALVVNLFHPIVFYFDETKEYIPLQTRYIMLTLQVVLFAATAIYPLIRSIRISKRKDRLHHLAVGLSGVVMTVFIVLQMKDPFMPLYAVGCLVATSIIHAFVEMDEKEERDRQLGSVKRMAYKDPLTNVKNITAYTEAKSFFDNLIKEGELKDFGVIVFDLNNLKTVNDTRGHDAGDKYIQRACRLICNTFKHSPVYRIGGDEFVAFLEGEDYQHRVELIESFNSKIENNVKNGGVIVSEGLDVFDPEHDHDYDEIFERADRKMYERKKKLKGMNK